MATAYLLCRAADTVADTELLPAEGRLQLLREIKDVFCHFPLPDSRADALCARLSDQIGGDPTPERILIRNVGECLLAFRSLSSTDRALIQRVVVAVATGMEMDLRHFGTDPENVIALATEKDLEQYIGWIGGDPGRFWTDICVAHGVRFSPGTEEPRFLGFRFGTGLQMVNILRDLPTDLRMGRCYLPLDRLTKAGLTPADLKNNKMAENFHPLYRAMIDETIDRISSGLRYVERLPRMSIALRAAVWWPLAIALKTLSLLKDDRNVLEAGAPTKIPRSEVYWLMGTSLLELPFNSLLRNDFEDLSVAGR